MDDLELEWDQELEGALERALLGRPAPTPDATELPKEKFPVGLSADELAALGVAIAVPETMVAAPKLRELADDEIAYLFKGEDKPAPPLLEALPVEPLAVQQAPAQPLIVQVPTAPPALVAGLVAACAAIAILVGAVGFLAGRLTQPKTEVAPPPTPVMVQAAPAPEPLKPVVAAIAPVLAPKKVVPAPAPKLEAKPAPAPAPPPAPAVKADEAFDSSSHDEESTDDADESAPTDDAAPQTQPELH